MKPGRLNVASLSGLKSPGPFRKTRILVTKRSKEDFLTDKYDSFLTFGIH